MLSHQALLVNGVTGVTGVGYPERPRGGGGILNMMTHISAAPWVVGYKSHRTDIPCHRIKKFKIVKIAFRHPGISEYDRVFEFMTPTSG